LTSKIKYTNSQLIEGIRLRDDKVFEYIEKEFKESIRIHILSNSGSSDDAEDIYQDGVLRIMEMADKHDFKLTCELSTLLYAICDKKWKLVLDKKRISQNYHIRKNEAEEDSDMSEGLDSHIYNNIFWESFNMLQDDCKRLLKACLKEIPIKEIADILDYTYGYVRRKKCLCHDYFAGQIINHPDYKHIKKKEGSVRLY
jgi:RNA polymerase sigma factor (sigma-70 family)